MTTSNPIIEVWGLDKIRPYPKNAKKHSAEQVEKLAKSIAKFGWTAPITIDEDGVVVTGHGRRLAAIKLGLTKVPVIVHRNKSPEEIDALRLADNRITSTEYDQGALQEELARLADIGFDVDVMGFDARELEFLTAELDVVSDSMFVEDVSAAVEDQKDSNAKKTIEIEEAETPVVDALGFKRVTVRQSRAVRNFIAQLEEETGEKGIDALMSHITDLGVAA